MLNQEQDSKRFGGISVVALTIFPVHGFALGALRYGLLIMTLVFMPPVCRADSAGMTMFNSANQSAINLAGIAAVNSAISESSRHHTSESKRSASHADQEAYSKVLTYTPSPAVTQAINQRIINSMSAVKPSERAKFQHIIGSGFLQQEFHALMAARGYSSHNIADVTTIFLLLAWETVRHGNEDQHPRGVVALHNHMIFTLEHNPKIAALTNAQKQKYGEMLANMVVLGSLAVNGLTKQHDTAGLAQLRASMRQTAITAGVDVGQVQLTDNGFVPDRE